MNRRSFVGSALASVAGVAVGKCGRAGVIARPDKFEPGQVWYRGREPDDPPEFDAIFGVLDFCTEEGMPWDVRKWRVEEFTMWNGKIVTGHGRFYSESQMLDGIRGHEKWQYLGTLADLLWGKVWWLRV